MRAFLSASAIAIVVAIGAWLVLSGVQEPAYRAFTTSGARVSDPGDNLVGKNWFGPRDG